MDIESKLKLAFPYWDANDVESIRDAIERAQSGEDVLLTVPARYILDLVKNGIQDILDELGGKLIIAYRSTSGSGNSTSGTINRNRTMVEFMVDEGT